MDPSPHQETPLSIEPYLGWRCWRLQRIQGKLTLISVTSGEAWPAREPMRARCRRYAQHAAPALGCMCGLYAASSSKALARAHVYQHTTSVVGAIAMWGTVMEYTEGAKSSLAYPARLALACGPCLAGGGHGTPEVVVTRHAALVALCRRHRLLQHERGGEPAAQVQAELLATYGVEPMPFERITPVRRFPAPSAHGVVGQIAHLAGGLVGLMIFMSIAMFVVGAGFSILAIGVGIVTGNDASPSPSPAYAAPAAAAPPTPGDVAVSPLRGVRPPGPPPPHLAPFAFVCGIGEGRAVILAPCGDHDADLIGATEWTAPHGAKEDCVVPSDAYSRGPHYWVCWMNLHGANLRPWPKTPNPFLIPESRGGAAHADR
jgi:hypothetical protein